jgi:foldase protein PrsA
MTDKDLSPKNSSIPEEKDTSTLDSSIETSGSKSKELRPRRKKWPWYTVSFIIFAALVFAFSKIPFFDKEVIATVNGDAINKDELYQVMVKQAGEQSLDRLITEKLIDQEAKAANVNVTDQDIMEEIDIIKKDFPSEEEFENMLAQYGMTLEDLKAEMKTQLQIKKIFEPQIKITEDDVKKYFEENKDQYSTPEQVRASHILVETKEAAQKVLEELKNGADFGKLAKEKSQDPGSKELGGDLGYFPRGKMAPEFEAAAFSLNNGELSGVVQTQFGFHIIKVVDKKAAQIPTYEEKKEEVRKQLFNDELKNKVPEWINKIRTEAKIENYLKESENKEVEPKK